MIIIFAFKSDIVLKSYNLKISFQDPNPSPSKKKATTQHDNLSYSYRKEKLSINTHKDYLYFHFFKKFHRDRANEGLICKNEIRIVFIFYSNAY